MSAVGERAHGRPAIPDRGPWEALVVGAGPAGATAARELALRGLSVLLVDRQRFPRPKVCGCCLAADALDELAAAGLGDLVVSGGAVRLRGLRVAVRGRVHELPVAGGRALSRRRLDAALVEAARDAGARCLLGARATPGPAAPGGRRVRLDAEGDTVDVRASVIVAADGVGSPFVRAAREIDGAPTEPAAGAPPVTVGVGTVLAGDDGPAEGIVAMAVAGAGYVGMVRLEDGSLDVAAALRRERLAGASPAAVVTRLLDRSGLADLVPVEASRLLRADWSGTPALRRRSGALTAERVVAVGDAAGYWEPFTGEGIAWALRDARDAADEVAGLAAEWSPARASAWARRARAARDRRQRHCRRVAAIMARPRLAAGLLGLLARWPGLLSWLLPGQRFLSTGAPSWRSREARA